MATVNLHTGIPSSPKFAPLSDAALRLWLHALCWSKEHLTDGFIPDDMVPSLHRQATKVVTELLVVRVPGKQALWQKVDGGYRIHDYSDWQDSADAVQTRRRKWRESKRGATKASKQDSTLVSMADSAADSKQESATDSRYGGGSGGGCGSGLRRSSDDDRDVGGSSPPGGDVVESSSSVVATASTANRGGPEHLAVLELVALWNRLRTTANTVALPMGPRAYTPLLEAVRRRGLDAWEATIRRIEASDYLAGRGPLPGLTLWRAVELAERIDSGQYDPRPSSASTEQAARAAVVEQALANRAAQRAAQAETRPPAPRVEAAAALERRIVAVAEPDAVTAALRPLRRLRGAS